MLILGVEPSRMAYKTIMRTDTLYELYVRTAGLEPATNGFGIHHSTSELSPRFTSFNFGA